MIEIVIAVVAVIAILILIGVGVHIYVKKNKEESKSVIRAVVDEVNKANLYTYNYEKTQGDYIKNIDHNLTLIDKKMQNVQSDMDHIHVNAVTRQEFDEYKKNLKPNVFSKDIQVADVTLSTMSKKDQADVAWLNVENIQKGKKTGILSDYLDVSTNISTRGDIIIANGAKIQVTGRGAFIERNDATTNGRFGVGNYNGDITRTYSTKSIAMSKINGDGTFQDLVTADVNKVNVTKPLCLNDTICLVADGANILACPAENPVNTNKDCKQIVS